MDSYDGDARERRLCEEAVKVKPICSVVAATMGVAAPLRALLLVGAAAGAEDAEQRLDEAACRALGFGPSLLCSSCDRLGEFVGADDALVGECRSCCTADSSSSSVYASATLDVCR